MYTSARRAWAHHKPMRRPLDGAREEREDVMAMLRLRMV
jgi:hypothetical protein